MFYSFSQSTFARCFFCFLLLNLFCPLIDYLPAFFIFQYIKGCDIHAHILTRFSGCMLFCISFKHSKKGEKMQNVNLIRKNVILGLLTTISDSYLNQENSIVANNSISDKTSTIKKGQWNIKGLSLNIQISLLWWWYNCQSSLILILYRCLWCPMIMK